MVPSTASEKSLEFFDVDWMNSPERFLMSNEGFAATHALYLRDLGYLIRELAIESKQVAATTQSDFATGYMAGFHRVVSLMQQQAESFGIPLEDIALDEFDPNTELV